MSHKKRGLPKPYPSSPEIDQFHPEVQEDRDAMMDEFYRKRDADPPAPPLAPVTVHHGFGLFEVLVFMVMASTLTLGLDSLFFRKHLQEDLRVEDAYRVVGRELEDYRNGNKMAVINFPDAFGKPQPVIVNPISPDALSSIDATIQHALDKNDPCRAVPLFGR